jgi:hypothetical protein
MSGLVAYDNVSLGEWFFWDLWTLEDERITFLYNIVNH